MDLNNRNLLSSIARGLLLAAAAVAAYLGLAASGAPLAGCGEASSCAELSASKWSHVFGVPVAFLGAAAYLLLASVAGAVARKPAGPAVALGLVLMLVIPALAAWFTIVQMFIVGAFCPWCCLAHLLAVLAVAALVVARLGRPISFTAGHGRVAAPPIVAAATLVVVALIAVLSMGKERAPGVAKEQLGSPLRRADLGAAGQDDGHLGTAVELHGGKVKVWPEELPGFGNPAAKQTVVLLSDFTCEHCRSLHAIMEVVSGLYGDQLGVVVLPATRSDESLLIQRVALALHRENPDLYRALALSLGSGEVPATASAVADEAARLVGAARLAGAMREHKGWIDAQLAATRELRAANAEQSGRNTLPQLMVGDEVVFGAHPSPGYYVNLLQQKLDLLQVAVVEAAVGSGSGDERPELALKSRKIALGGVRPGAVLNVSVPFENTGEGPLVFNWIKTPPGVEVANLPSGEIEPGASGEIAFDIRVPQQTGALGHTLVVHSNAQLEGLPVHITGLVTTGEIRQANAGAGEPE